MPRTISTSVKPIGYYVSLLPDHIEEELGSHFENLTKPEQYTLLATFAGYLAFQAHPEDYSVTLQDIYNTVSGYLPDSLAAMLEEIEDLERVCDGTVLALSEALILNIHYTNVDG